MSNLVAELAQQIKLAKMPAPETEYRFAPPRRWRFDFCWPVFRVAVEVEGGIWTNGRHTRGKGFENDCRKYSIAAIREWRVIRVTGGMIKSGEAMELIDAAGICGAGCKHEREAKRLGVGTYHITP